MGRLGIYSPFSCSYSSFPCCFAMAVLIAFMVLLPFRDLDGEEELFLISRCQLLFGLCVGRTILFFFYQSLNVLSLFSVSCPALGSSWEAQSMCCPFLLSLHIRHSIYALCVGVGLGTAGATSFPNSTSQLSSYLELLPYLVKISHWIFECFSIPRRLALVGILLYILMQLAADHCLLIDPELNSTHVDVSRRISRY